MQAYAPLLVAAAAINNAKSLEPADSRCIKTQSHSTPFGPIKFDNGQNNIGLITQVQSGQYKVVFPQTFRRQSLLSCPGMVQSGKLSTLGTPQAGTRNCSAKTREV